MEQLALEDFKGLELDDSEFRQVQETYVTLENYYDEIAKAGHITRYQAEQLVKEFGVDFVNAPLTSFTNLPTTVNHGIALEGIGETAIRLIGEFIQKAIALLKKIAEWMVDAVRRRKERDRSAGIVARNIALVKRAVDQLRNIGADTAPVPEVSKDAIDDYVEKVDSAYRNYYDTFNELSKDVLSNGVLSRTARSLNFLFTSFTHVIESKLDLFEEIMRAQPNAHDSSNPYMTKSHLIMIGQLKTVATPIPAKAIHAVLKTCKQTTPDEDLAVYLNTFVSDIQLALRHPASEKDRTAPDDAALLMTNNRNANTLPYRMDAVSQDRALRAVKSRLDKILALRPSNETAEAIRSMFQDAISQIQREIVCLNAIVDASELLSNEYDTRLVMVLSIAIAEKNLLQAKANQSQQQELSNAASQVDADLRNALKH